MFKTAITTPFASAARTATASSELDHTVENFDEATLCVNVTAASGTSPTLAVSYEISPDGGTTWFTHTAGATITAAGNQVIQLTGLGRASRVTATIGGTAPSFTFSAHLICKRRA